MPENSDKDGEITATHMKNLIKEICNENLLMTLLSKIWEKTYCCSEQY